MRNISVSDNKPEGIYDRRYNSALRVVVGIMRNGFARKTVTVQEYKEIDKQQMDNKIKQMADRIEGEDARKKMSKEFKNMIYPKPCFIDNAYHTVCELPQDFVDKYCILDKAVIRSNFTLHSRVVAALNFAEIMKMLNQYFNDMICRITPDAFYINSENGDVQVLIERLFFGESIESGYDYYRCESEVDLAEEDLIKFEAYTIFRLLCADNPYDGRDTLIRFPLLSAQALKRINSGEFGFIFSDGGTKYSEYIGKETYQRWKNLPLSLRKMLKVELERKPGTGNCESTDNWLKHMRMLRDCLVFENGQFRLCDPDVSEHLMYIKAGDYSIPVKQRKAIYWYHIGMLEDMVDNGIVAGINAEGFIENYSRSLWVVITDMKIVVLQPGERIKLMFGMQIKINGMVLRVVNGGNAVQAVADMGTSVDQSAWNGMFDMRDALKDM